LKLICNGITITVNIFTILFVFCSENDKGERIFRQKNHGGRKGGSQNPNAMHHHIDERSYASVRQPMRNKICKCLQQQQQQQQQKL